MLDQQSPAGMGGWLLLLGASLLFSAVMAGWRLFDLPDAHASIFIAGPVTLRMAEATPHACRGSLASDARIGPTAEARHDQSLLAGLSLVPLIAAEGEWKLLMAAI